MSYGKRHSMKRSNSKKYFTKTAKAAHKRNSQSPRPMRGGIRL